MTEEGKKPRRRTGGSSRPTLHDVARACGVSAATVSNVINGRAGFVGEKTKKRVLKEIERLQYRPQAMARGLRMSRRHSIAMVIVDESESYLEDIFVAKLVAGFSAASNSRGYTTVIHGSRLHEFGESMAVRQLQVDGYCVMISGDVSARLGLIEKLCQLDQPIVLVQESPQHVPPEFGLVQQDDFGGGRQLADHLLARGAKTLVVLVPELSWSSFESRTEGLRAGLANAGSDARLIVLRCRDEKFDSARQAMDDYLKSNERPDVFIAGNDQLGIAALHSLREHGVAVPGEVMVTGFNDFEIRKYATPLLTTISSPAREVGITAASKLIDRIETGGFETPHTILPVQFALGQST